MAVISALRTAGRAVVRNPIILLVTALFGAIQLPQLLAQALGSVLASLLSFVISLLMIFIMPFFQAGLIGMANEAIDGRTRVETLVSKGKKRYVSVFGAYLLVMAVSFVFGIIIAFGAFAGLGTVLATGGEPSFAVLAVLGLLALLLVGAYLLAAFFFQFYVQAIVIEDVGAIAGLKHSYRCVRANLVSTFGYVLLAIVVGVPFGLLAGLVSFLTMPADSVPFALPSVSGVGLVGVAVLFVAISGLLTGFLATYSVAFYREIRVPVSA